MTRQRDKDTVRIIVICCVGSPLFFLHYTWANMALQAYLLTALLFGMLLVGEYPPLGSRWFWKTIVPLMTLHSVVVAGIITANLRIPGINRSPRVLYGFLGVIGVLEWRLFLSVAEISRPKDTGSKNTRVG